jgi:hypothetical protein
MQAVVLLSVLFLSSSAFSKGPTLKLEIKSQGQWGRHWTLVHQKKNEWWCVTDLSPFFELKKAPFEDSDFKGLSKKPDQAKKCQTQVIVKRFGKKEDNYAGCGEDERFKLILDKISRACGR